MLALPKREIEPGENNSNNKQNAYGDNRVNIQEGTELTISSIIKFPFDNKSQYLGPGIIFRQISRCRNRQIINTLSPLVKVFPSSGSIANNVFGQIDR